MTQSHFYYRVSLVTSYRNTERLQQIALLITNLVKNYFTMKVGRHSVAKSCSKWSASARYWLGASFEVTNLVSEGEWNMQICICNHMGSSKIND